MAERGEVLRQDAEQGEMWLEFTQTRAPALRALLIEKYAPLVRILAAQNYAKRIDDSYEFHDLYQWGMVGLLEAIDRFEPDRGANFKTYAEHRIRGEILSGLSRVTEVASQVASSKQRRKERAAALSDVQGSPFELLMSLSVGLAIGFMLEDTGMYRPGGEEPVRETPYQSYALKQLGETFRNQVTKLPARQQQVIRLHYFNGLQFADVAKAMGISKGRVSQLHKEGLEQLRGMLGQGGSGDWLG